MKMWAEQRRSFDKKEILESLNGKEPKRKELKDTETKEKKTEDKEPKVKKHEISTLELTAGNGKQLSQWTDVEYPQLMTGIRKSRTLKELNLFNNLLMVYPDEIKETEEGRLQYNKNEERFKLLCNALAKNKSIRTLELGRTKLYRLEPKHLKMLADAIANHPCLTSLSLSKNELGIEIGSDQVQYIDDIDENGNYLEFLLEDDSLQYLFNSINKILNLKFLNLNSNKLGYLATDKRVKMFADFIRNNHSIEEIQLGNNCLFNLSLNHCTLIWDAFGNNRSLKSISLNRNALGMHLSHLNQLAQALSSNTCVKTLLLDGNHFSIDKECLREDPHYRSSVLCPYNFFLTTLSHHPSIQRISLRNTHFPAMSTGVFNDFLFFIENSKHLIFLDLYDCDLGKLSETRFKDLMQAIKSNTGLKVLHLGGNHFDEMSNELFKILMKVLSHHPNIEEIDLRYNDLEQNEPKFKMLLNFIKTNRNLKKLCLWEIDRMYMGDYQVPNLFKELIEVLKKHPNLVDFQGVRFNRKMGQEVLNTLAPNIHRLYLTMADMLAQQKSVPKEIANKILSFCCDEDKLKVQVIEEAYRAKAYIR